MTFPWEKGVMYVAIDPAQRKSAVAYQGFDAQGRRRRGVFRIDDIRFSWQIEARIKAFAEGIEFTKIILAVEYPTWNAGASQTVRGAANTFIRMLKDIYPRLVTVQKIDPNKWQGAFGYRQRAPGKTTKEHSFWLARNAYGWVVDTEDEADAAMILEYARSTPIGKAKAKPARG